MDYTNKPGSNFVPPPISNPPQFSPSNISHSQDKMIIGGGGGNANTSGISSRGSNPINLPPSPFKQQQHSDEFVINDLQGSQSEMLIDGNASSNNNVINNSNSMQLPPPPPSFEHHQQHSDEFVINDLQGSQSEMLINGNTSISINNGNSNPMQFPPAQPLIPPPLSPPSQQPPPTNQTCDVPIVVPTLEIKTLEIPDFLSKMPPAPEKVERIDIPQTQLAHFDEERAKSLLEPQDIPQLSQSEKAALPSGYAFVYNIERGAWVVINPLTGAEETPGTNEPLHTRILRERGIQTNLLRQSNSGQQQPQPRSPAASGSPVPPRQSTSNPSVGPWMHSPIPPLQQQQQQQQQVEFSLPYGWIETVDSARKRPMYTSNVYKKNMYTIPAYGCIAKEYDLPSGWVYQKDQGGRPFYVHKKTGFAVYEKPKYFVVDDLKAPVPLIDGWKEEYAEDGSPVYRKEDQTVTGFPIPRAAVDSTFELPPGWTRVITTNDNGSPTYIFKTGYRTNKRPEYHYI